jgi:hypothetical protein
LKYFQKLVISEIIMGVEHGGAQQGDGEAHRRNVDHVDGVPVRHTPALELGTGQASEGAGAVPVEVFNGIEELQRQLAEAQAKTDRLEQRHAGLQDEIIGDALAYAGYRAPPDPQADQPSSARGPV